MINPLNQFATKLHNYSTNKWKVQDAFKLYFDICIDDLVGATEINAKNTPPNALGVMLGYSIRVINRKNVNLRWILEAAYVTPTFGIRSEPLQTFYARRMYIDNTVGGMRVYIDYHFLIKGEETGIHTGYYPRGITEIKNELKIKTKYKISNKISATTGGTITYYSNKDHIKGNDALFYGIFLNFSFSKKIMVRGIE